MSKRLSDRLQEICDALGCHAKDVRYQRLRPGHWQRSAGAWSFAVVDEEGREVFGSPNTLEEVVVAFDAGTLGQSDAAWNRQTYYAPYINKPGKKTHR